MSLYGGNACTAKVLRTHAVVFNRSWVSQPARIGPRTSPSSKQFVIFAPTNTGYIQCKHFSIPNQQTLAFFGKDLCRNILYRLPKQLFPHHPLATA